MLAAATAGATGTAGKPISPAADKFPLKLVAPDGPGVQSGTLETATAHNGPGKLPMADAVGAVGAPKPPMADAAGAVSAVGAPKPPKPPMVGAASTVGAPKPPTAGTVGAVGAPKPPMAGAVGAVGAPNDDALAAGATETIAAEVEVAGEGSTAASVSTDV